MTAWWPGSPAIGALAEAIRDRAIRLYRYGAAVAARRGILLADTKFEFGMVGEDRETSGPAEERLGRRYGAPGYAMDGPLEQYLTLIDEVLTPDSSRFWDAADYEPGRAQASFDKQFVRDWLETQPWDKTDPGPGAAARGDRGDAGPATSKRTSGSPAPASLATSRRTSSPHDELPVRRQRHAQAGHPRSAGAGRGRQPRAPRDLRRQRRPRRPARRADGGRRRPGFGPWRSPNGSRASSCRTPSSRPTTSSSSAEASSMVGAVGEA